MVVLGMVFPAPKPITLGRASLMMMGFGAVKIVGAVPIHWRASTHPLEEGIVDEAGFIRATLALRLRCFSVAAAGFKCLLCKGFHNPN